MRVANPILERGNVDEYVRHYNARLTDCSFLSDPMHYEYPRGRWVVEHVTGGSVLEVGCGNGGMTRLLAPRVDSVTALDISGPSLDELDRLKIPNVTCMNGRVETLALAACFDWVVASEVIEHVQRPIELVRRCVELAVPGGSVVITTPNGHWESDEHVHEWSLSKLASLVCKIGEVESVDLSYLRDAGGRRRWIGVILRTPVAPPTPDSFFDRTAVVRMRRRDK